VASVFGSGDVFTTKVESLPQAWLTVSKKKAKKNSVDEH
jgi:hypothetical protein